MQKAALVRIHMFLLLCVEYNCAEHRLTNSLCTCVGVQDLYLPSQMVDCMNSVSNINAKFLDQKDNAFFEGWGDLLNSHFASIPALEGGGYTKNHFFEFSEGIVTMRHLTSSDTSYEHRYIMPGSATITVKSISAILFGDRDASLQNMTLFDVKLPKHAGKQLAETKVLSMSQKYFSIPHEYRSYYPAPVSKIEDVPNLEDVPKKRQRKSVTEVNGPKLVPEPKPGRPKVAQNFCSNAGSITRFLKPVGLIISPPASQLPLSFQPSVLLEISPATPVPPPPAPVYASRPNVELVATAAVIPRRWGRNGELHIPILYSLQSEFGVPWANNSCAFDSFIGGGLWAIFRHSSETVRDCFRDQLPAIAGVFDKLINQTINNLEAKDELTKLFEGSQAICGTFVSTDAAYQDLTAMARTPSLFALEFSRHYSCNTPGNGCTKFQRQRNITWVSVEPGSRHMKSTMQDTVTDVWEDPDIDNQRVCKDCNSKTTMKRRIISTPMILMVRFGQLTRANAPIRIQDALKFQGSDYNLRAIVYGNGTHFMTRYKTSDGHVYDYDGMYRHGSGHPITRCAMCVRREGEGTNSNGWFTGVITNFKRDYYIVVDCMYVNVIV